MSALSMRERIAQKRGDIAANKSKGLKPYKFKNGKTLFRILPMVDPTADWWRDFGQLYLKSFDGSKFVVIGDRQTTFGESEPIRDMIFAAMKAAGADTTTRDHFKEMLGGQRVLFNALILSDPNQPATEPVLIEISQSQFDDILAQFDIYFDAHGDDYDLASLAKGHVFQVERSGTTKTDTEYKYNALPKQAPLGPQILEKAIDMDAWIKGLFEDKEAKALELLGSMGVNVSGASSVGGLLTGGQSQAQIAQQPATNLNAGVVTHAVDDVEAALAAIGGMPAANVTPAVQPAAVVTPASPVIEDAVFEPAVVETPAPAPVAPVQPAATPAASSADTDIEAILASLT